MSKKYGKKDRLKKTQVKLLLLKKILWSKILWVYKLDIAEERICILAVRFEEMFKNVEKQGKWKYWKRS